MNIDQGLIFDIQRFSIHDGPGIRTLVFLKGCPLRCPWCSNPEGQEPKPELTFRKTLCIACGSCREACPTGAIALQGSGIAIVRQKCDLCGECVKGCPSEALSIAGRWMTVDEVLEEVERDRCFYETSQGGITLSGGEPLHQIHFTENLLKACKTRGLSTAMETSGYAPWSSIGRILPYVDTLLFDMKHMDPSRHRQQTGVSNEPILENLRKIAHLGNSLNLRYTIVPGHNDDQRAMEAFFRFARSLPGIRQLELLPYHRLGETKYGMLGRTYALAGVWPLSRQEMEPFVQMARREGLGARIVM